MTKVKLGEQLKETRKELEEIRKKLQKANIVNRLTIELFSIKVSSLLEPIEKCDNTNLSRNALSTICEFLPKKGLFNRQTLSAEKFVQALDKMIEVIDTELPKEESIDLLEEKILNSKIILPYEEKNSILEEKIHQKARKIAQILIENTKS